MQTSIKNKAYLSLTATSIIWGTTWVASRIGVEDVPGLQVSYLRQFLAGCILLTFYFIKGEKLPTWPQFRWLFVLSIFMFVLANGFSTWSVKYIPSGLASLISALAPIFVVLIDLVFFRQFKNSGLTYVGLFIGFAGVGLVFYENAFHQQPEGYFLGVIYGLIAMLAWSIGTIFLTRNKYNVNPYYAMGWQMFLSSFMIFALAKVTGNDIPVSEVPLKTWGAIAYLIIAGSVFAFAAFIYSIKHLPVAIASLYAYINPIVAMICGTLILDEPFTLNLLLGAVVTLVGVYLVNYSVKKV
ncbi:EamA family transporter [Panacibacter sp. DH6]|uniref:EamA family transporter n=1 Tax=Panacibacter microcysteis TaxID=2793269 RepID=A0A931E341_9BACT|nr:EamA family transporter [Panacibacter microcysteis]MBG9374691.1 EamA family transporter [Panacibacter microcysteis]